MAIMNEILNHENYGHGINQDVKNRLEAIIKYTENFEDHALVHSEKNSVETRTKMAKDIKKMKSFNEKSNFIDKKIEYDQRFFNDGYP